MARPLVSGISLIKQIKIESYHLDVILVRRGDPRATRSRKGSRRYQTEVRKGLGMQWMLWVLGDIRPLGFISTLISGAWKGYGMKWMRRLFPSM